jgi:hypothetical protein
MRVFTAAIARGNPTLDNPTFGWFKVGAPCIATSLRCNPTFEWHNDGQSEVGITTATSRCSRPSCNTSMPPILEQTGSLLTGAETDKLRLQNRRRCHALQEQQVPTTLWSTHMGQASLPPRQECPLEYRNKMCPAGIATSHPAGELLSEWSQLGCPTKRGRPWSKEELREAVA